MNVMCLPAFSASAVATMAAVGRGTAAMTAVRGLSMDSRIGAAFLVVDHTGRPSESVSISTILNDTTTGHISAQPLAVGPEHASNKNKEHIRNSQLVALICFKPDLSSYVFKPDL